MFEINKMSLINGERIALVNESFDFNRIKVFAF